MVGWRHVQNCTALSSFSEMETGGELCWLLVLCDDLLRDGTDEEVLKLRNRNCKRSARMRRLTSMWWLLIALLRRKHMGFG
jgi:hypothetical protein